MMTAVLSQSPTIHSYPSNHDEASYHRGAMVGAAVSMGVYISLSATTAGVPWVAALEMAAGSYTGAGACQSLALRRVNGGLGQRLVQRIASMCGSSPLALPTCQQNASTQYSVLQFQSLVVSGVAYVYAFQMHYAIMPFLVSLGIGLGASIALGVGLVLWKRATSCKPTTSLEFIVPFESIASLAGSQDQTGLEDLPLVKKDIISEDTKELRQALEKLKKPEDTIQYVNDLNIENNETKLEILADMDRYEDAKNKARIVCIYNSGLLPSAMEKGLKFSVASGLMNSSVVPELSAALTSFSQHHDGSISISGCEDNSVEKQQCTYQTSVDELDKNNISNIAEDLAQSYCHWDQSGKKTCESVKEITCDLEKSNFIIKEAYRIFCYVNGACQKAAGFSLETPSIDKLDANASSFLGEVVYGLCLMQTSSDLKDFSEGIITLFSSAGWNDKIQQKFREINNEQPTSETDLCESEEKNIDLCITRIHRDAIESINFLKSLYLVYLADKLKPDLKKVAEFIVALSAEPFLLNRIVQKILLEIFSETVCVGPTGTERRNFDHLIRRGHSSELKNITKKYIVVGEYPIMNKLQIFKALCHGLAEREIVHSAAENTDCPGAYVKECSDTDIINTAKTEALNALLRRTKELHWSHQKACSGQLVSEEQSVLDTVAKQFLHLKMEDETAADTLKELEKWGYAKQEGVSELITYAFIRDLTAEEWQAESDTVFKEFVFVERDDISFQDIEKIYTAMNKILCPPSFGFRKASETESLFNKRFNALKKAIKDLLSEKEKATKTAGAIEKTVTPAQGSTPKQNKQFSLGRLMGRREQKPELSASNATLPSSPPSPLPRRLRLPLSFIKTQSFSTPGSPGS